MAICKNCSGHGVITSLKSEHKLPGRVMYHDSKICSSTGVIACQVCDGRGKHDDCWIVAAYYGDSLNPDVRAIRQTRDKLVSLPLFGALFKMINWLYNQIGKSALGYGWRVRMKESESNSYRLLARVVCQILLLFSRTIEADKIQ